MATTARPITAGTALVDELRAWLDEQWDPDLSVGEWWDRLGMAGWAAPMLPVDAYGRGLSRADAMVVAGAIADHGALGAPEGMAISLASPTIAAHGTPEQIDRLIPPAVCGRIAFCQLFSEPGAGSDLAGLTTRAERDGETWHVNGQKVWTSGGQFADMGMLLARTNPEAPKHRGITWFAIDMHQPGIDVRPLREMTGSALFNEVFITDATVGDDNRIGDVGDGWKVANTTLFHERSGMAARGEGVGAAAARAGTVVGDLDKRAGDFVRPRRPRPAAGRPTTASSPAQPQIDLATTMGRLGDPTIRQRIAQSHILGTVSRLNAERLKAVRAGGGDIPGAPNFGKLLTAQILRHNRDLNFDILGARGTLHAYGDSGRDGLADAPGGSGAAAATAFGLMAQALPIYGGTDQIQRNIVGERALGLPKEPGDLAHLPFTQLPKNG
ncbi:MAG TPA: acyl-CoA dehydrogenase family protein [Acidimicrobiales bacterium]|nr:acyl-CoA dehydrogenase family protein [Acidimicrobiales bacterium]